MEFATNPYSEKNFDEIYKPAKALGLLFAREALNLKSVYNTEVYINQKLTQVLKMMPMPVPLLPSMSLKILT